MACPIFIANVCNQHYYIILSQVFFGVHSTICASAGTLLKKDLWLVNR
jgi:hypothetical protein